ncbi:MAG TPA: nucleoside hydrolase [Acidimicrobiales bacterium]|jgi:purine nucleosidase|nr:nucleoside hydrolase [Acidimicrobiales bacterium]
MDHATEPRPVVIDTDTASDDAVALVMALRHPGISVEAVTVVAGNVPLAQGVQNACYTVELCGASTPVYAGAAGPLLQPLVTAQQVHGQDGMGDIGLPLAGREPAAGHAVDALLAAAQRHAGRLTLVTLGPLTNVALAVRRDARFAGRLANCVAMVGTSDSIGNQSAVAEFNAWVDPEAVAVVLDSGMPLTVVGWDVSRRDAVITADESADLRGLGTPLARFVVDIQSTLVEFCARTTHLAGFDLPDPVTMAVALDPSLAVATEHVRVDVDIASPATRGQLLLDRLGLTSRPPNASVVTAVDRARFREMLRSALR